MQDDVHMSSSLLPLLNPLPPKILAPQFQRLYETKAEADADKARQIRELNEENARAMERIRRGNNTELKKEVRCAAARVPAFGWPA